MPIVDINHVKDNRWAPIANKGVINRYIPKGLNKKHESYPTKRIGNIGEEKHNNWWQEYASDMNLYEIQLPDGISDRKDGQKVLSNTYSVLKSEHQNRRVVSDVSFMAYTSAIKFGRIIATDNNSKLSCEFAKRFYNLIKDKTQLIRFGYLCPNSSFGVRFRQSNLCIVPNNSIIIFDEGATEKVDNTYIKEMTKLGRTFSMYDGRGLTNDEYYEWVKTCHKEYPDRGILSMNEWTFNPNTKLDSSLIEELDIYDELVVALSKIQDRELRYLKTLTRQELLNFLISTHVDENGENLFSDIATIENFIRKMKENGCDDSLIQFFLESPFAADSIIASEAQKLISIMLTGGERGWQGILSSCLGFDGDPKRFAVFPHYDYNNRYLKLPELIALARYPYSQKDSIMWAKSLQGDDKYNRPYYSAFRTGFQYRFVDKGLSFLGKGVMENVHDNLLRKGFRIVTLEGRVFRVEAGEIDFIMTKEDPKCQLGHFDKYSQFPEIVSLDDSLLMGTQIYPQGSFLQVPNLLVV